MSSEINTLRELFKLKSAKDAKAVTPNDSVDIPLCDALVISSGGTIKLTTEKGTTDTYSFPAGVIPLRVTRVWASGLSASGITALYN